MSSEGELPNYGSLQPYSLLMIPSIYFFWLATGWAKGGLLEEKIRIREEFLRIVGVKDGEKVLDVGTGAGLVAIGFAKAMKSGEVVGIDIWMMRDIPPHIVEIKTKYF